jgi:hypothetical protein
MKPVALFLIGLALAVANGARAQQDALGLELRLLGEPVRDRATCGARSLPGFRTDDSIPFEILLSNESAESIFLEKECLGAYADNHAYCDIQVMPKQVSNDKGIAIPGVAVADFGPRAEERDFFELPPDYVFGKKVTLRLKEYFSQLDRPEPAEAPPGIYEFTAAYSRSRSRAEEDWAISPWHGELKSNHIELCIVP